jgi:hypothetical protein
VKVFTAEKTMLDTATQERPARPIDGSTTTGLHSDADNQRVSARHAVTDHELLRSTRREDGAT